MDENAPYVTETYEGRPLYVCAAPGCPYDSFELEAMQGHQGSEHPTQPTIPASETYPDTGDADDPAAGGDTTAPAKATGGETPDAAPDAPIKSQPPRGRKEQ